MLDVKAAFPKRTGALGPNSIALGTMNFGKRTPEREALAIVDRAFERGIRLLDTANVYENGASERIVAHALAARPGELLVATKVGLGRRGRGAEGLAPEVIRAACEESLARLGVSTIDLYYLHAPDPRTPIEKTLEAFASLVRAGKVRALGVSNYASWQILEMLRFAEAEPGVRPIASQVLYNVLVRQLDVEYFPFAERYALHTTSYNALAGGLLARRELDLSRVPPGSRFDGNAMYQRRYWSRAFFEAMARYRGLAEELGRTLASLAYGFLAATRGVDSVLLGPATVAQLDEALDALAAPLDSAAMSRVDEISRDLAGTDARYAR